MDTDLAKKFDDVVQINPLLWERCDLIVENSALVQRCINEYADVIRIREAKITYAPSVRELEASSGVPFLVLLAKVFKTYYVPFAQECERNTLIYGAAWWVYKKVTVDASDDPVFVEQFRGGSDYTTEVMVPMVPDVSQLNFFSCLNMDEPAVLRAEFKSTIVTKRRLPKVHVVHKYKLNHAKGRLCSPTSSILHNLLNLLKLEELTKNAAIARANPITLVEHYNAAGANASLNERVMSEGLAGAMGGVVNPDGSYSEISPDKVPMQDIITEENAMLNRAMAQASRSMVDAVRTATQLLDQDEFAAPPAYPGAGALPSSTTRLAGLPSGIRVGGQAPRPEIPPDTNLFRMSVKEDIAVAFGIPIQRLTGTGTPKVSSTQQSNDRVVATVMESMAQYLASILETAYADCNQATVRVKIPLGLWSQDEEGSMKRSTTAMSSTEVGFKTSAQPAPTESAGPNPSSQGKRARLGA